MHSRQKNDKINNIISNVKLGGILVLGIIFFKQQFEFDGIFTHFETLTKFIFSLLILSLVCIFYYIYSTIWYKKLGPKAAMFIPAVEYTVSFALFASAVVLTGGNESPYKVLFLFIIIPISIQYGFRFGLSSSVASSLFLFVIDIAQSVGTQINIQLENDIIVSSIFMITAWFLSYYVKLENEHAKMLEDRANIDSLTGLFNHRFFHDKLKQIFEGEKKSSKNISLIFIDVDYFKEYNDMYGHLSGDSVLKDISEALKETAKDKNSIICRYGGDEFAIIITHKNEKYVIDLAEKIRKTLEEMYFHGQEHLPSGNVTASIGIAFCNEDMKTYPELIKCADDALYRAKFINKNKVEVYSSVFDMIKNDIEEEHFDLITSIKTLISVINAKDRYTYGHVERVVTYVKMFADEIMLSDQDKKTLIYSAYMHDIGKINIPEVVLNKKMPLDYDEWLMIKQHPQNGVEIVNKVESLSDTAPIILHHHERYDGKGYPESLKGDEIPYLSRMLIIADSFDAMTFSRPYKPAMTFSQAVKELEACSGKQFDPHLTRVFIRIINRLKSDTYPPHSKNV